MENNENQNNVQINDGQTVQQEQPTQPTKEAKEKKNSFAARVLKRAGREIVCAVIGFTVAYVYCKASDKPKNASGSDGSEESTGANDGSDSGTSSEE